MDLLAVIKNVSFIQDRKIILKKVSATFKKGKLTTLIGPNGGGKSTLLKLVAGIEKPSCGVVLCKKNIKIGYMPQKIQINPELPLKVKRFLRNQQVLEFVNAQKLLDLDMAHLSGGEMQRVLLAYALQSKPDLLLLDEPTQGLDITGEQQLYELIFEYQKQTNCGIIMASHDLDFVLARSNEVLCLNGHICCSGCPDSVLKKKSYQELFEKVPYTHHHNHIHRLSGEIQNV